MFGLTFEQLRLPLALVLLLVAGVVFLPRDADGEPASGVASPEATIVVGQPGGEVVSTGTPAPQTQTPTATAGSTSTPSAQPTEQATTQPVAADGFVAEIVACRSISGSTCNDQLGTLPPDAGTFTALVRFSDANAGDTINAVLTGPSGTIPGGAYTLGGGGDGYYYSTFTAANLPPGDYTLTATRNSVEVAVTTFSRAGG